MEINHPIPGIITLSTLKQFHIYSIETEQPYPVYGEMTTAKRDPDDLTTMLYIATQCAKNSHAACDGNSSLPTMTVNEPRLALNVYRALLNVLRTFPEVLRMSVSSAGKRVTLPHALPVMKVLMFAGRQ